MATLSELRPVDGVEVTIIVDGSIDVLLPSGGPALRPRLAYEWADDDRLRAEHGYGTLVRTWIGDDSHALIFDAGLSPTTFLWNCDVLDIRPSELEAILLSHGHIDHHGGLEAVFRRYGRARLPIVLHPDAHFDRKIVFPSGVEIHMPPPRVNDLERDGARVLDEGGPTLWGAATILLSGQVERTTAYEQGLPLQQKREGNDWVPDPWIWDDQNLVVHVRDRGLVVLSSCSHAGTINVLRNAQRLTGVERIHAFVGGMHLSGGIFEKIIPPTLDDLAVLAPDYLVPGHCSGYRALAEIVTRFPTQYLASSVGSRYRFAGPTADGST